MDFINLPDNKRATGNNKKVYQVPCSHTAKVIQSIETRYLKTESIGFSDSMNHSLKRIRVTIEEMMKGRPMNSLTKLTLLNTNISNMTIIHDAIFGESKEPVILKIRNKLIMTVINSASLSSPKYL